MIWGRRQLIKATFVCGQVQFIHDDDDMGWFSSHVRHRTHASRFKYDELNSISIARYSHTFHARHTKLYSKHDTRIFRWLEKRKLFLLIHVVCFRFVLHVPSCILCCVWNLITRAENTFWGIIEFIFWPCSSISIHGIFMSFNEIRFSIGKLWVKCKFNSTNLE